VTRAGDGASIGDTGGTRDDGSNTDDEARFCRSDPRIAQECRTTIISAMSLDKTEFRLLTVYQAEGPAGTPVLRKVSAAAAVGSPASVPYPWFAFGVVSGRSGRISNAILV